MIPPSDCCTVTEFTAEHWQQVFQLVVREGLTDDLVVRMGDRLIALGLATANEVEIWNAGKQIRFLDL